MYENLFSPITINKLEIKNRIAYPSLATFFSTDRKLNDRFYNFFREKARGGTGMVTFGPVGIDSVGSGILAPSLQHDEAIPSFRKMASIIKEEGGRAWIQLFHAGAYSNPFMIDGKVPIAPTAVYSNYSKLTPREMTSEDIKEIQEAFANAAARAKEAGFDGIEIIGSAGYLICQFLSPLKNQRTDEYGGSFENRTRFPREVVERIRKRVGADFPLTVRMAGNDFVPGSNTDSEMPEIARMYEKAGIDAINVTGGWHEARLPQMTPSLPRSAFAFLALNIKKAVSIPIIASNRITTPEDAEEILKDGYADMVNLGRVLIADPHWPNKAKAGNDGEIRPCVACLQGCMDNLMTGQPISCVANPIAGFEGERKIVKAEIPKNVMVVGAGVAGLEAAVTAAMAGHNVELYDKSDDVGGQMWIAGAPPHKQELFEFIRYYCTMLNNYPIKLYLETEVDTDLIKEKKPDHLIIAEGAEALIPPLEGADDGSVVSAWDVLKNNPPLGREVAVIGGGSVGLETALFVASKGTLTPEALHFLFAYEAESVERLRELMFQGSSQVTVFEMLPKAGKDVGKSTKWVLLGDLDKHGVVVHTETKVVGIDNGKLTYEKDGKEEQKQFDTVVVAAGSRPVQRLSTAIEQLGIPYTTIGDCVKPGRINDAIHSGFLAALEV
ncbi:MAG: FAD-dependent oxidoreductase [Proteobacteria bacterium]|nr:FAD-dependent oxidoreductase [Pseudomonadota bacterium]